MKNFQKKLVDWTLIFLLIFGIMMAFRVTAGEEDAWICEDGKWIKHGNPSSEIPKTLCQN